MQASNALESRVANFLIRSIAFHVPRVLQAEIPPRLTEYMLHQWAPAVSKARHDALPPAPCPPVRRRAPARARSLTPRAAQALLYDVLHALTHSLSSSISHLRARDVTQVVTHSITQQLIHYYYCIYCYSSGEVCRYWDYYNDGLGMGSKTVGKYGRVEETIA